MPTEAPTSTLPENLITNRLLSGEQVAEILKVGKSTLYRLLSRKQDPIPSLKIGNHRRFKLDQVLWWIDKHEVS